MHQSRLPSLVQLSIYYTCAPRALELKPSKGEPGWTTLSSHVKAGLAKSKERLHTCADATVHAVDASRHGRAAVQVVCALLKQLL